MTMGEQTFTNDEMDAMRASVRAIMEAEDASQKAMATESGIPYGTFTGWLAGKYAGDNARVAVEVQIWLASREEKKRRSEEHTSELQSLMRISYAVFCLKKKKYT